MQSIKNLFSSKDIIYVADTMAQALEKIRKAPKIKSKDYNYAMYLIQKRQIKYMGNKNYEQKINYYRDIECYIPLYDISSKQWKTDYPKWRYIFTLNQDSKGVFISLKNLTLHDSFRHFYHLTDLEIKTFVQILKEQFNIIN